ncbi:MAG: Prephenate dehydrogenase [Candidatus Alkanophagales archaeon MCA70_species_2]|nr:Prephenate dehydrogenase [Candidatus Alkanophaga liquidiphilum]RLG38569.1 MAG: prephenate dehydrogenase/arogenate dehydrogenase family protein [Candidatus Alkanophagales archaeon]
MDDETSFSLKVAVVGGAGGMGRWFSRFFKEHGAAVTIIDVSDDTERVAADLEVKFLKADACRCPDVIRATDVVLVSVPIDVVVDVIKGVAPEMRPGTLLCDVTSVKRTPMEAMLRYAAEGVEVLGTHPMFGPTAKSLQGQTMIVVRGRHGRLCERICELFRRDGARLTFTTAEAHDEAMRVIQGLTHFVLIAYGLTLRMLDFDVSAAKPLMSPLYEIIFDIVGRILHQNPHLYGLIQMNLDVQDVHEAFIEVCERLSSFVAGRDIKGFAEAMRAAASHFGDTKAALERTDKLIYKIT